MSKEACRSKIKQLDEYLCKLYSQTFKGASPDDQFWKEMNKLDRDLGLAAVLNELGATKAACNAYLLGFRKACKEAKRRAQQAGADAAKGRPRAG